MKIFTLQNYIKIKCNKQFLPTVDSRMQFWFELWYSRLWHHAVLVPNVPYSRPPSSESCSMQPYSHSSESRWHSQKDLRAGLPWCERLTQLRNHLCAILINCQLQAYVSDIPLASEKKLNVQMCGYDFTLLESYQSFVHNLCENMGVDVQEWWR